MKDNFSTQSDLYAKYRPTYPNELFEYLLTQCINHNIAWDVATGNGQAAVALTKQVKQVYATDISEKQIQNASTSNSIIYKVEQAESTSFKDNMFDLITVAQALHWVKHDIFFNEVIRVAVPDAVFAAWGYNLIRVEPAINNVIDFFYKNIIHDYWDAERKHVDNNYADITMPYPLLEAPKFHITQKWCIEDMLGYLHTWSAVQHYIKLHNTDPVKHIEEKLKSLWQGNKTVTFPIFFKAFRIKK